MASVITSVRAPAEERDAWQRAADVCGVSLTVWVREALNAGAEATLEAEHPRERVVPAAYTPPELPPLPAGAKSAPEPVDLDLNRQRGLVAAFIRIGGKEWKGQGPNPLHPGCQVRADVLREFSPQLTVLEMLMDDEANERAVARAMGVPV